MKPEPAPAPSKARVETSPEERDWIARCRAGDARAYRALVERYQDRAYALAYRMVRSRPDAEEIAQDAFVRAWRAIGDFRGDATFMTWLYRILVRLALDRAETLKNRRAREIAVEDPEQPDEPDRRGPGRQPRAPVGPASRGSCRPPSARRSRSSTTRTGRSRRSLRC